MLVVLKHWNVSTICQFHFVWYKYAWLSKTFSVIRLLTRTNTVIEYYTVCFQENKNGQKKTNRFHCVRASICGRLNFEVQCLPYLFHIYWVQGCTYIYRMHCISVNTFYNVSQGYVKNPTLQLVYVINVDRKYSVPVSIYVFKSTVSTNFKVTAK
jgi:hypothetical protein